MKSIVTSEARQMLLPSKLSAFGHGGLAGSRSYLLFKRIFDVMVSVIILLGILSWLFPLVALLILLDSRGPVFFVQRRVGRGGKYFSCYKFRTMIVNSEADLRQALPGDERITRMGSWLRGLNLDELPQVINVLLGQMSLVGPRPHMIADHRRFAALIPQYMFRHSVRPGITGLAQVNGYCGPALDKEKIAGRYYWDAFYVRHAGLWLDCKIIFRTLTGIS